MKIRPRILLRYLGLICILSMLGWMAYKSIKRRAISGYGSNVELSSKELSWFEPVSKNILAASTLTLLEGLPHPKVEPDEYQKDLASKKTVSIHGHHFYETPLQWNLEDLEPLRKLCADPSSYWRWSGLKLCDGYHPDYCLIWKNSEIQHQLLICFGCQEIKLFYARQNLYLDLRDPAFAQLGKLLIKYHSQRPYGRKLSEVRAIHGFQDEHPKPSATSAP